MKGVILAGGLGKRLSPMTRITNKHLLPINKKPMIYYPLQMLVDAGIDEIIVVTGGNSSGDFLRLIGDGSEFGLKHIHYTYQSEEGGIAQALGLAKPFVEEEEKIVVVLGDNLLQKGITEGIDVFKALPADEAMVFLAEVKHPWEYGVAEVRDGKIRRIVEKPAEPASNLAVIGVYMYPPGVFDFIEILEPSARGEIEITDLNNMYLERGKLNYRMIEGWWLDAGENPEALRAANLMVAREEGADI